jgi:LysR family transcriptional regulator, transcriptional activator for dmlA
MVTSSAPEALELGFFTTLASAGSLSAAGREMGVTTAAVSKRLTQMEARLGVSLVLRTTRRMSLTPEGELYLAHARRILGELEDLQQLMTGSRQAASGLLRINATLGFGRTYVAPIVTAFSKANPQVQLQLQLSASPPPVNDDLYDICIRFGAPPDSRVVARLLAPNERLLCASPNYLSRHPAPQHPRDLAQHNCICIRQEVDTYGVWRFVERNGKSPRQDVVKAHGSLASNDGEIAVKWALDGLGIVMRAEWDIRKYLASGRLVQVLPNYRTPDADVYAVYSKRQQHSTRVRSFVGFIERAFEKLASAHEFGR